jgi:hypothetical protein
MTLLETPDPNDLPAAIDRRPTVGTFTMLNTIKNICEHQGYRRYIKKDMPFVSTPAMKWGKEVHTAFEARVGKGKVLPDHMKDWEKQFCAPFDKYKTFLTEQKLGMTVDGRPTGFWHSDVWFRGLGDFIVIEGPKAMLLDWKTGNSKYEDPWELETNALLLKAHHPKIEKVAGRYAWLKDNKWGQLYDLSNFQKTYAEIKRLMDMIAEKKRTGAWEKMKSGLCGFCPVEDCENHFVARK